MEPIEKLIKNNEYPIVFVGSGMSRRYIDKYPNWLELLEEFWHIDGIGNGKDFYSRLHEITETEKYSMYSDNEKKFYANIEIASEIDEKVNQAFFNMNYLIPNLSTKDVFQNNLSPFKEALAHRFKDYNIIQNQDEEILAWKKFIRKSQIIITTNYDTFIEDTYHEKNDDTIKTYIGQEGFFDSTIGWAELFKIHGSIDTPSSIVINGDDYAQFDKNSVLISAKIITTLIHSPIIFLGYSMTDINVRKIISSFAKQIPKKDVDKYSNKIIIVERKEGEQTLISSVVNDQELGCIYTKIETDNYKLLFNKLAEINQGLTPIEVRKFQSLIRDIVVEAGHKQALKGFLVSPEDLENLKDDIDQGKPIIVALGDRRNIFVNPDIIQYLEDYLYDQKAFLPQVAFQFLAKENMKARIPFMKYIRESNIDNSNLNDKDKRKVKQRLEAIGTLDDIIDGINKYHQVEFKDLDSIIKNKTYSKNRKIEFITYNIKRIGLSDVEQYIRTTGFPLFKSEYISQDGTVAVKTALRKLFLAYDLLKYNDSIEQ